MKLQWMLVCAVVGTSNLLWAQEGPALKTDKDRLSYSIGASVGKNLRTESTDVDLELLIQGLKTSLASGKLALSEKEMRQVMNDYQGQMRQRGTVKRQQAVLDNKKKGESYLAQYKSQPGVLELPGGVLYKILKAGTGRKPLESDMVEVNYRGALISGLEFDATEPGKPANLKVSSLIAGWKQALGVMPLGSKWQLVIPAALAYGERGVGNDIGPNEVLLFDLELLGIK